MKLDPKDLKVESYPEDMAGSGSMRVPTLSKGVKITHVPTGISVSCVLYTSQHKNKARCLEVLEEKVLSKDQIDRITNEIVKRHTEMKGNVNG